MNSSSSDYIGAETLLQGIDFVKEAKKFQVEMNKDRSFKESTLKKMYAYSLHKHSGDMTKAQEEMFDKGVRFTCNIEFGPEEPLIPALFSYKLN
jgi:hypothetical protein